MWHRYTERRLQAECTPQLEKSHLSPDRRQLHISSVLLCQNNILMVTFFFSCFFGVCVWVGGWVFLVGAECFSLVQLLEHHRITCGHDCRCVQIEVGEIDLIIFLFFCDDYLFASFTDVFFFFFFIGTARGQPLSLEAVPTEKNTRKQNTKVSVATVIAIDYLAKI